MKMLFFLSFERNLCLMKDEVVEGCPDLNMILII